MSKDPAAVTHPRLGPYRILRELGRGGMGRVFLAARDDDQFQRQVAIKIADPVVLAAIPPTEREAALARFRFERQTLAGLDHPNCVKLLDGGTTGEGLPYLVMDYVEGQAALDYCRTLTIRERMQFFLQVCGAVQHAHQRMLVHGDIKPSNLLVTAEGVPKLLDFGIARMLRGGAGDGTVTQSVAPSSMSVAYASPELIRGERTGVASDIYQLGGLAYELITGRHPFVLPESTPMALAYAITNTTPAPPSQITRVSGVNNDLDAIVAKAMAKEPEARYGSVLDLAADVQRWLAGYPVSARPSTILDHLRKAIARHPLASALAVVSAVLILLGLAGIVWQGWMARIAEQRAAARFQLVRELANNTLFEIDESIRDLPGATSVRLLIVRKASEYLSRLSADAAGDNELLTDIANSYVRLGDVQGNPYKGNIGDTQGAIASYDQALKMAAEVLRRDPRNAAARRVQARATIERAAVSASQGNVGHAVEETRRATATLEDLARDAPVDAAAQQELASAYESLADLLGHPGYASMQDSAAAREAYEKSLAQVERVLGLDSSNFRARRARAVLTMKMGDLAANREDVPASLNLFRKAMAYLPSGDTGTARVDTERLRAGLHNRIAYAVSYGDDPQPAYEEYAKGVAIVEDLMAKDPNDIRLINDLLIVLRNRGELREFSGDQAGAIEDYRRILDGTRKLLAADPKHMMRRQMASEMQMRIARVLLANGQAAEARKEAAQAVELARQAATDPKAGVREFIYFAEILVKVKPEDLRRPAEARQYAERADKMQGGTVPHTVLILAEAHYQMGDAAAAVRLGEKALALIPATSPQGRQIFEDALKEYRAAAAAAGAPVVK